MQTIFAEIKGLAALVVGIAFLFFTLVVLYKVVKGDKPFSALLRWLVVDIVFLILFEMWE